MENPYEGLSLEKIRATLDEFHDELLADPTVKPDITIVETETTFAATIRGGKPTDGSRSVTAMTGVGGLEMFLDIIKGARVFLKIEYNGVILSREKAEEFFKTLKLK